MLVRQGNRGVYLYIFLHDSTSQHVSCGHRVRILLSLICVGTPIISLGKACVLAMIGWVYHPVLAGTCVPIGRLSTLISGLNCVTPGPHTPYNVHNPNARRDACFVLMICLFEAQKHTHGRRIAVEITRSSIHVSPLLQDGRLRPEFIPGFVENSKMASVIV